MVLKQHPRVAMIYDMTRAGTERSARAHRLDALWSRTTRASVSVSKVLYIVLGIGRTVLYRADGNHSEDTSKFFPFSAHEPERRGHRAPDRGWRIGPPRIGPWTRGSGDGGLSSPRKKKNCW